MRLFGKKRDHALQMYCMAKIDTQRISRMLGVDEAIVYNTVFALGPNEWSRFRSASKELGSKSHV